MLQNTKLIAVLQVIFFIIMIIVNALANSLPMNGYTTAEVSAMYPNLFVPAGFTFSIWGVIYLFLLVWVVYSGMLLWKKDEHSPAFQHAKKIAPLFIITCVLNASWIIFWQYLFVVLSLIIMLWLLRTLVAVYNRMQKTQKQITGWDYWLLVVPFVIYLAWICVATIANTSALLVDINWNGFGLEPWIWSCIMIAVATFLAFWFSYFRGELAFALVIAWALYGIYSGQSSNREVSLMAIGCCGFSTMAGIIGFMRRNRRTALEGII
ncbi:MAG: TspO/MBR family protein [Lacibacter sp.]